MEDYTEFLKESNKVIGDLVDKYFKPDGNWYLSCWVKKDQDNKVYIDGLQIGMGE